MGHPLVVLPLALGLAAWAVLIAHVSVVGVVRQPDEGTAARLFQLFLAAQAVLMAAFAAAWLPRAPGRTLRLLALQAAVALAAVATVAFLER